MNSTQVAIIIDLIPAKIDGKHLRVATHYQQFEGYVDLDEPINGILVLYTHDDLRCAFIDVSEIVAIEGDAKDKNSNEKEE